MTNQINVHISPESDLNMRRQLCQLAIKTLDAIPKDDPDYFKAREAMEHYKEQLANIDQKIFDLTGKHPPIIINLQTAVLFPKSIVEIQKE